MNRAIHDHLADLEIENTRLAAENDRLRHDIEALHRIIDELSTPRHLEAAMGRVWEVLQ